MTVPPPRRRLAEDSGFTLIELLVTMTLALVVLFAVLGVADTFTSRSAANSRLTDAQDRLRATMGTLVRDLRDAPPVNPAAPVTRITPIAAARAGDVVFRSPRSNGWLRYCVGPNAVTGVANDALRIGRLASSTYSDPGAACPAGSSGGWTYGDVVAKGLRGGTSTIAYSCNPTACANPWDVQTVTLSLAVEHNRGKTLRLISAVTPRNRG